MTLRWMPADLAGQPEGEGGAPVWHPARCTSVAVPRCDAWDGLFLECAVEWPLQLLFPPEVGVWRLLPASWPGSQPACRMCASGPTVACPLPGMACSAQSCPRCAPSLLLAPPATCPARRC